MKSHSKNPYENRPVRRNKESKTRIHIHESGRDIKPQSMQRDKPNRKILEAFDKKNHAGRPKQKEHATENKDAIREHGHGLWKGQTSRTATSASEVSNAKTSSGYIWKPPTKKIKHARKCSTKRHRRYVLAHTATESASGSAWKSGRKTNRADSQRS